MSLVLKQLSSDDGEDIYAMLQEIPADENGLINPAHGKTYEEYKAWLERAYAKLPKEFMGFKRSSLDPVGGNRHGVIRMSEFFVEKTGLRKTELFRFVKSAILYFVSGDRVKHNILTKIRYPV